MRAARRVVRGFRRREFTGGEKRIGGPESPLRASIAGCQRARGDSQQELPACASLQLHSAYRPNSFPSSPPSAPEPPAAAANASPKSTTVGYRSSGFRFIAL